MSRRHFTFRCEGEVLAATLDEADRETGLLIVSGGNEVRGGAYSGHARLAAELAAAGFPVFRYDRRGVGDSEGTNTGFRGGGPDLYAALAAFREAAPLVRHVVAFGNCDGATTLALHASGLALDGLVLANPWVIDGDEAPEAMPSSAIRARYLEKLANPRELLRLLRGGVDLRKLASGLRKAAGGGNPEHATLAAQLAARLGQFDGPVRILLAERDRTAQLFREAWPDDPRVRGCASRSHSFADPAARAFLLQNLREALAG